MQSVSTGHRSLVQSERWKRSSRKSAENGSRVSVHGSRKSAVNGGRKSAIYGSRKECREWEQSQTLRVRCPPSTPCPERAARPGASCAERGARSG
eukprot:2968135-Rhodomonas_salina.1